MISTHLAGKPKTIRRVIHVDELMGRNNINAYQGSFEHNDAVLRHELDSGFVA